MSAFQGYSTFKKSGKVTRGQIRCVRWLFQNSYWSEIYSP